MKFKILIKSKIIIGGIESRISTFLITCKFLFQKIYDCPKMISILYSTIQTVKHSIFAQFMLYAMLF